MTVRTRFQQEWPAATEGMCRCAVRGPTERPQSAARMRDPACNPIAPFGRRTHWLVMVPSSEPGAKADGLAIGLVADDCDSNS